MHCVRSSLHMQGRATISRYISETVQASAKVTIEREYEVIWDLSNGVIFNDIEWPPNPAFKIIVLFIGLYLKSGALRQRYYRTLIWNHRQTIGWYQFRWPWLTLNPEFKVAIFFKIKFVKNGAKRKTYTTYRISNYPVWLLTRDSGNSTL